ncbi:uncharacterized protein LOC129757519 [Uranotaenia lowii]|uniref:uncharacterized protein LOC129757519 n=1 Tax=Uranotaenia lowii TaxID=190385 RepID=UPI0024788ED1|nr:uncharacterized protein LOC129757519 [Uranotaenia lowii]
MLPSNQHQHPSSQQQPSSAGSQQQDQQQHLLNTVGMSAAYTPTSYSYPLVSGHHLNENNNLVMHPSYGKPAAHVAHQLPPASLITLQPVPLDAHGHGGHGGGHHGLVGQPPTHTVTSLSHPPPPPSSMSQPPPGVVSNLAIQVHAQQQHGVSMQDHASSMMSHSSSLNDSNGSGMYCCCCYWIGLKSTRSRRGPGGVLRT